MLIGKCTAFANIWLAHTRHCDRIHMDLPIPIRREEIADETCERDKTKGFYGLVRVLNVLVCVA